MRGYQNGVYTSQKNIKRTNYNGMRNRSYDDFRIEEFFARGNSRFINEPFEFTITSTISPFNILEAYYHNCLKTRPFIQSSKRTVLLKSKTAKDDMFTAVNVHKFIINYKGKILGVSESLDKHGVADKTAFQIIKKYISPIYEKIKDFYREFDDMSEYIIQDCDSSGLPNCAINIKSSKSIESAALDHNAAVLSENNFKEYMALIRVRILGTEGFLDNILKLAVTEKFNSIMGRFMKISTKIYFDIPGVKNELSVFTNIPGFKTLYPSRFSEKKANSTAAMIVINYNRFINVPQKDYVKSVTGGQVSFISYEVGVSKKEAKSRAISTFLLNTIPELVPEESLRTNTLNSNDVTPEDNMPTDIKIKENINLKEDYEKLKLDDPEVLVVENGFKTNQYEHKNPMSLLNEIFSKLYKTSLASLARFNKLQASAAGITMELVYKHHKIKATGRTKKITENKLCLKLMKKMFPGVEFYSQLIMANKDTSQLNRVVDVSFISDSSVVSLNYIQTLVQAKLKHRESYSVEKGGFSNLNTQYEHTYENLNSMGWVETR